MRRLFLSSSFVLASFGLSPLAEAQAPAPSTSAPSSSSSPSASDATSPSAAPPAEPSAAEPASTPADSSIETPYDDATSAPEQPNALEPPTLTPLEIGTGLGERELPDPNAAADRLEQATPEAAGKRGWTLPETVFHLHGYLRLRGTFLKDGALGHRPRYDRGAYADFKTVPERRQNYDPFPFFTPDDSTRRGDEVEEDDPVKGGCGDSAGADGRCDKRGQVSGDLRLRLKPEIHLSDDVRVKAWVDVLDNVGLGTLGYGSSEQELTGDSAMRVRRAWGEARNRDIGELRFGRMGADWGLGILDNGGDRYGIDSDFSSEVDRIMGLTHLAGFYLMAAYDWASEGKVLGKLATPSGVPVDVAQRDDHDAFTVAVARKLDDEVQQSAVARGETVFNYGLYFIYRKQLLRANTGQSDPDAGGRYLRLDQKQFVPDAWFQVLWEGLRVELEAAFVAGSREGRCPRLAKGSSGQNPWGTATEEENTTGVNNNGECKFRQLGVALEAEYRLFDERLGLHLMSGFASGDSNAYGLAATNDPTLQRTDGEAPDRTVSTFGFHPDYRIDLILWRTVMRRIAGAYYVKPGLSYDFIRDPYGQLAGGRVDVVYSRASSPKQTWGGDGNLGLEIDLSLYYRSEDGPDPMDGFYGLVQWGVLFPFTGLGYSFDEAPGTKNAMILRGVAGIAF